MSGKADNATVLHSIAVILTCRFILDLRSVYQKNATSPSPSWDGSHTISSVGFAIQSVQVAVTASVVGNMGALLHTGEVFEPGSADEDEDHFSDDPFNHDLDAS